MARMCWVIFQREVNVLKGPFSLVALAALASCTLAGGNGADDLNQRWVSRHDRPVNEEEITRARENGGYRSFHLGNGDRFSISEATLTNAFNRMCRNTQSDLQCDDLASYRIDVIVEESLYVYFYHRNEQAAFLSGFVCLWREANWECSAG